MWIEPNIPTNDYKFIETRDDKGNVIRVEAKFSKAFLKNRDRYYDVKSNRYIARPGLYDV
jgi:hypothetical protein